MTAAHVPRGHWDTRVRPREGAGRDWLHVHKLSHAPGSQRLPRSQRGAQPASISVPDGKAEGLCCSLQSLWDFVTPATEETTEGAKSTQAEVSSFQRTPYKYRQRVWCWLPVLQDPGLCGVEMASVVQGRPPWCREASVVQGGLRSTWCACISTGSIEATPMSPEPAGNRPRSPEPSMFCPDPGPTRRCAESAALLPLRTPAYSVPSGTRQNKNRK